MYDAHGRKRQIVIWLKVTRKRSTSSSDHQKRAKKPCDDATNISGSNFQGHLKNLSEVQTIVDELDKKHGDSYTPEQLRVWAHMIQLKKHGSYDIQPSKPFFKTKKIPS